MFFRSRNRLTPLALGLLIALGQAAPAALAEPAAVQRHYRIEPGALDAALTRFAGLAGVTLTYDPALARGKRTGGLDGSYGVEAGFAALLAGTGLEWVLRPDGSYSLRPLSQDAALLKAVKVQASGLDTRTEGSDSYTTSVATVGGRMGESLREVPRSISVISRQQLDDQRILSLYDAMNQLPGVTTTFSAGNANDASFYSRGHALTSIMADGLSISSPVLGNSRGGGSNSGMAKYDSVQLLRGPDGLFSGNGQPSGTINLVRKRPTDSFQLKTALSAGSWDNYAGEIDLSSPLLADGRVRGRLVLARNTNDHFYDSDGNRKSTVYGVIDADLSDSTVLGFGASLDTQHGAPDQSPGLPRYADGQPLSISRSVGYPDWAERSYDIENLFVLLEHEFNEQWRLKAGASRTTTRNGHNVMTVYQGVVNPETRIGEGGAATTRADWNREVDALDINLIGDLNLWNRRQQFAFGADYSDMSQYSLISYHSEPLPVQDWSDFDPDRFVYPPSMYDGWDNDSRQKQRGFYAYGNFQIHGPLKLVLGGRYASFETWSTGTNNFPLPNGSCASWTTVCDGVPHKVKEGDNNGYFTPYYGLIYDFADNWTAYLTRAESYEDQSNYYTTSHSPLDPTEGESWELGIKGEHFDGRLNSNVTFYRTTRDNYRVSLGTDPAFNEAGKNCCYRGDGKFLAQGVEIDISGALTDHWQINAGYTYDDNKTEYGSNDGNRYASYTPKHIFRLWSSYRLQGALAGLKVGGGVQAQSGFFNSGTVRSWNPTGGLDGTGGFDGPNVAYQFSEPGRALWNVFAEYRIDDHWTAALNVNNLFDKRYYQVVGTTSGGNYYGTPRNMLLTLRGHY